MNQVNGFETQLDPKISNLITIDQLKEGISEFAFYRNDVMVYKAYFEDREYLFSIPLEEIVDITLYPKMLSKDLITWIQKNKDEGTLVIANPHSYK